MCQINKWNILQNINITLITYQIYVILITLTQTFSQLKINTETNISRKPLFTHTHTHNAQDRCNPQILHHCWPFGQNIHSFCKHQRSTFQLECQNPKMKTEVLEKSWIFIKHLDRACKKKTSETEITSLHSLHTNVCKESKAGFLTARMEHVTLLLNTSCTWHHKAGIRAPDHSRLKITSNLNESIELTGVHL